jgi:hypothetical protein
MSEFPKDSHPSFWASLGLLVSIASDLGRAIAVVGGLAVGFTALSRMHYGFDDWVFLAISGAVFSSLVYLCRK